MILPLLSLCRVQRDNWVVLEIVHQLSSWHVKLRNVYVVVQIYFLHFMDVVLPVLFLERPFLDNT